MKKSVKFFCLFRIIIISLLAVVFSAGSVSAGGDKITKEEVINAQKAWSDAVVGLGKKYTDGQDYRQAAKTLLDDLYAYQTGQVLFKPTKAADIRFRTTKEGALSYFVGHNKSFPEDKGFALKPWIDVRFKNAGIYINGDVAMAMGKYFFTPLKGNVVKVEYAFGYVKDHEGKLKIILHHSSLPYTN